MNTLDDTVHTILAPIDLLAEQLHTWAGWIAALEPPISSCAPG